MNNQSSKGSSCFEQQNLYHKISLLSQNGNMQPQLLQMLEREETRDQRLGFVDYEELGSSTDPLQQSPILLGSSVDDLTEMKNDFQSRDTLQSLVESCTCDHRGHEKSIILTRSDHVQECKLHQPQQRLRNLFLKNYQKNNNIIEKDSNCWSKGHVGKQQVLKLFAEKEGNGMTKKARIRWSEELHNKFIECVHRLGGAKKATPKGILKLMKCDGLTIYHVKSHLQKFRVCEEMPQEKQGNISKQLESRSGVQIVEALRLQMDVQRQLYEQLQSQKMLQVRIEEQAKQLQKMFENQLNTNI